MTIRLDVDEERDALCDGGDEGLEMEDDRFNEESGGL